MILVIDELATNGGAGGREIGALPLGHQGSNETLMVGGGELTTWPGLSPPLLSSIFLKVLEAVRGYITADT